MVRIKMAAWRQEYSSSSYVCLSTNPLRFEPVSKENSVFFDEANKQVFSVKQVEGYTRVIVTGSNNERISKFEMPDKGHIVSIKFSLDQSILAVQRNAKAVDFLNFSQGSDSKEYQQICKNKTAQIIGFNWTGANEIVFNTNQGLELYQVFPDKKVLKLIKNYNVQVNWFVYLADISLLLFSSTSQGNVIHPYSIRSGAVIRLPKFEVELPPLIPYKPKQFMLLERDVTISVLYGEVYVVVMKTQSRETKVRGERTSGAEVVLYRLLSDRPARKSFVLQLNTSGRFALNIVDNLVIVHHQASKTSMLFDIKMKGTSDGQVTYLEPVLSPLSIDSFSLYEEKTENPDDSKVIKCEMYSANWIVFQPNIVIDAKLGCLWGVYVRLEPLLNMIADKAFLIQFLLLRRNAKGNIIDVLKQALMPRSQCSLAMISKVFDKLNDAYYKAFVESETFSPQGEQSRRSSSSNKSRNHRFVDQKDMYKDVFSPVLAHEKTNAKFMIAVLIEYIRSINEHQMKVDYNIHELLINTLVHTKKYYQLHQLLQYHVITDSKLLACVMLSLETDYPPAYQLALDMLKRLNKANEEIVEILLSKGQLLAALRFLRSVSSEDSASPQKFLEAAVNCGDNTMFYTVFKFFEQRNQRLRGNPMFVPGEHCEKFVELFKTKFGDTGQRTPLKT
ncbi:regulator of MON1-CCZ1 complex-like [Xenia sp. Carnegie-2017]|uniref:regulator of MON1-CCZ1 complex-like n=1 Tax=Xenia sp. Carnegie-2017 TaxID=2897299 RepID=UPI001F044C65|nr:regulator of MON1-CCZ1 complex-like [Xenia sp. Carnegie-2017]